MAAHPAAAGFGADAPTRVGAGWRTQDAGTSVVPPPTVFTRMASRVQRKASLR